MGEYIDDREYQAIQIKSYGQIKGPQIVKTLILNLIKTVEEKVRQGKDPISKRVLYDFRKVNLLCEEYMNFLIPIIRAS